MITVNKTRGKPGPIATAYPFYKMKVGDVILVHNRNAAAACASRWSRNHGEKFSVRKYGDRIFLERIE